MPLFPFRSITTRLAVFDTLFPPVVIFKKMKTVILDDDTETLSLLECILNKHNLEGHCVSDPEYAITLKAQVYLIDYNLCNDKYNGDDVVIELKQRLNYDATYISISGNTLYNKLLYDDTISKPFNIKHLIKTLKCLEELYDN